MVKFKWENREKERVKCIVSLYSDDEGDSDTIVEHVLALVWIP